MYEVLWLPHHVPGKPTVENLLVAICGAHPAFASICWLS